MKMEIKINFQSERASKQIISQKVVKYIENFIICDDDKKSALRLLKGNKLQYMFCKLLEI